MDVKPLFHKAINYRRLINTLGPNRSSVYWKCDEYISVRIELKRKCLFRVSPISLGCECVTLEHWRLALFTIDEYFEGLNLYYLLTQISFSAHFTEHQHLFYSESVSFFIFQMKGKATYNSIILIILRGESAYTYMDLFILACFF